MRIFPKAAAAIFAVFMILMVIVTGAAYSRRSGQTGLDMAKVQQIRQNQSRTLSVETVSENFLEIEKSDR